MTKKWIFSVFISLSFSSPSWATSLHYTCVDEILVSHELKISEGSLHLDGKFMFRDDASQTIHYNRDVMALYNDDDSDLLLPRNLESKPTLLEGLLVDYQTDSFHRLSCKLNL